MKRFRDEQLVHFRSVSIGRIDEIHAKLERATQNFFCILSIGRPTPYAVARQAHRAIAKPVYGKIATDRESRFRI